MAYPKHNRTSSNVLLWTFEQVQMNTFTGIMRVILLVFGKPDKGQRAGLSPRPIVCPPLYQWPVAVLASTMVSHRLQLLTGAGCCVSRLRRKRIECNSNRIKSRKIAIMLNPLNCCQVLCMMEV